jgi:phage terminase Nu1 subunit (DNA packaging protein)
MAGLFGVTRQTVDRWLKQGCPFVEKADRDRGREWQLSLPAVVEWREKRAVEQAIGDTSKLGIDEARRRKTAAEAALAELELARQRGEVVSLAVVANVIGDQLSACKARLLSIPTKISPLVATATDVQECRDLLDGAVREALDEITGLDGTGRDRPADFTHHRGDEGDDLGADESAAESDGEPVGGSLPKAKPRGQRRARPVEHSS